MARDHDLRELSKDEDKIKFYWNLVIRHLRTDSGKIDLAYLWTDEVRRDFEGIKTEAGKIAFFLRRLHRHYKTEYKEKYYKEISDIRNLLRHLNKIETKAEWVKKIKMDLENIIRDVEGEKVDIGKIDKVGISRRDLFKSAARFTGRAAAAALIGSEIPFLLSCTSDDKSKKYLAYEGLMKLIGKYGYIYYDSNIKSGEVPRIILFGDSHSPTQKLFQFLEEFFGLVDKEEKNLAVLFEGIGSIEDFKQSYKGFPIKPNALYFGIDTARTPKETLKYFADKFEWYLLMAFVNEATERATKIWQNPSSAGYIFLKKFDIEPTKGYSAKELKEKLYDRIRFVDGHIKEIIYKRDKTMMRNTIGYIKNPNYQLYQFFMIVGGSHVDTYGDGEKGNDRFSQFFNQNKISYFSILQTSRAEKKLSDYRISQMGFKNIAQKDSDSVYYSIPRIRKDFCKFYNIDEQLFFRLAKEK